jgi:hypothetical protein
VANNHDFRPCLLGYFSSLDIIPFVGLDKTIEGKISSGFGLIKAAPIDRMTDKISPFLTC